MANKKINIYIHSRGEFESYEKKDLENKAIIRLHNIKDKNWYNSKYKYGIELFFDDIYKENLSFIEKIKAIHFPSEDSEIFNKIYAEKLLNFIKKNKDKDFIIHCEFGKSRSVSVALFIVQNFNGYIANRTPEELTTPNDWVLELLNKFNI